MIVLTSLKMWFLGVLCFIIAVSSADISTPAPVYCGYMPREIYSCLGNPKIIRPEISSQCSKSGTECERIKCIYRKSGWMSGAQVNRTVVSSYLDEFARAQPAWSRAVHHTKAACLATELPAQGAFINCPAYDVTHCMLSAFFKNAEPSQWSEASTCAYARQFAASCPVCPEDCFAPAVPYGSCNACRILPQTPSKILT